jgi:hypothetical protein
MSETDMILRRFNKNKNIFAAIYPCYFSIYNTNNTKYGGGLPKKITVELKNNKYNFVHEKDDNFDIYMIYDVNDNHRCNMILIDSNENTAIIQNISGDFTGCPNGSKLLDVSIKFLKENKKIFNINQIRLKDNALKKCNGLNIKFGDMYLLLYGKTWYMSRGFIPYGEGFKNNIHKERLRSAVKNFKIMEIARVKNVFKLKKYIKKYGSNEDIKKFSKIVDDYPDMLIKKFIGLMLKKYNDDTCKLFYNIYQEIMFDLGLISLHETSFFKKI